MFAQRSLRFYIASAFLLQGCATPPAPDQLKVHPNLQVRHSTNETAEAYYQLGRSHQLQGNLDMALTGYTYAIARDPRHMEARNAAAAIHAQQGRLDQARAMMLAVIADYPSASQAHNNLGYIDYLRGDHAEAVLHIRQALLLDPRNERARNNLLLADTALSKGVPDLPAAAIAPAAPLVAAVTPADFEREPLMSLVQVIPNVYELKMTPKAPAPVLAALPVTAARQVLAASDKVLSPSRLEVANGEGTPGLARRLGALFGQHGFPVARLTNERPFGQKITRIQYLPAYAKQAEALRKLIDGPVQLAPVQSLSASADLRVVLGKDTQRALAQRDSRSPLRLATR
jgi:tetratricopeptide (TPR) repeat protein